jgi:hypothetical protein
LPVGAAAHVISGSNQIVSEPRRFSTLCRLRHNAFYADAEIMPMLVSRSLFLAEIAGKGLA